MTHSLPSNMAMLHRQIIYQGVIFRGYVIVKLPKGTVTCRSAEVTICDGGCPMMSSSGNNSPSHEAQQMQNSFVWTWNTPKIPFFFIISTNWSMNLQFAIVPWNILKSFWLNQVPTVKTRFPNRFSPLKIVGNIHYHEEIQWTACVWKWDHPQNGQLP